MKTKRSLILILVMLMLLPMALAGCKGSWPLSPIKKAQIKKAYKTEFCANDENFYQRIPLVWFDENGGERDPYVFRYFGTYGDCIVMLRYGDGQDATMQPVKLPITMSYLSRPVQYPVDCDVVLYNTNPFCPRDSSLHAPICSLHILKSKGLIWLTHGQLEQLTTDLENWLAEGNY